MAEAPSDLTRSESVLDSTQYWCYHCNDRVEVERLADLPDVVCVDCKNGFVESVPAVAPSAAPDADPTDDTTFGDQFIQVLRLIAQAARGDDSLPHLPPDQSDEDYLRIELDGWDNAEGEEDGNEDEDDRSVEVVREDEVDNRERDRRNSRSEEEEDDEEIEAIEPRGEAEEEDGGVGGRRRRDVLSLRLRDLASQPASRRNRILDWAEILMGLEDHSIELRLQVPDIDTYIGNPGDYVDAGEYEALLQNLADNDSGARRGAPPAAKTAVAALQSFVADEENAVLCAICKDMVSVGNAAKKLPCGHGYHGECIVPWLNSRNSCPVCRFELPTDDLDYEEDKKKKNKAVEASFRTSSSGSSL